MTIHQQRMNLVAGQTVRRGGHRLRLAITPADQAEGACCPDRALRIRDQRGDHSRAGLAVKRDRLELAARDIDRDHRSSQTQPDALTRVGDDGAVEGYFGARDLFDHLAIADAP